MSYRIKTAARLTGIPRNTLLAWERRYQVVEPARAPNGYRVYTDTDIARLISVRQLLDQGFKVGEAVRLLQQSHDVQGDESAVTGVRVAVVHTGLVEQLTAANVGATSLSLVRTASNVDALLRASPTAIDVLVVQLEQLGDQPRRTLVNTLNRLGISMAIVPYTYAPQQVLKSLISSGVRIVREPVRAAQLIGIVHEVMAVARASPDVAVGMRGPPPPVQIPELELESAPRRFSDLELARLAEIRSAIACECPNHLADLVRSLTAFEDYSARCIANSPEDEALHGWLGRNTSRARHVIEEMLWEIIVRDDLPFAQPIIGQSGSGEVGSSVE